jgi:hypothetical protein
MNFIPGFLAVSAAVYFLTEAAIHIVDNVRSQKRQASAYDIFKSADDLVERVEGLTQTHSDLKAEFEQEQRDTGAQLAELRRRFDDFEHNILSIKNLTAEPLPAKKTVKSAKKPSSGSKDTVPEKALK